MSSVNELDHDHEEITRNDDKIDSDDENDNLDGSGGMGPVNVLTKMDFVLHDPVVPLSRHSASSSAGRGSVARSNSPLPPPPPQIPKRKTPPRQPLQQMQQATLSTAPPSHRKTNRSAPKSPPPPLSPVLHDNHASTPPPRKRTSSFHSDSADVAAKDVLLSPSQRPALVNRSRTSSYHSDSGVPSPLPTSAKAVARISPGGTMPPIQRPDSSLDLPRTRTSSYHSDYSGAADGPVQDPFSQIADSANSPSIHQNQRGTGFHRYFNLQQQQQQQNMTVAAAAASDLMASETFALPVRKRTSSYHSDSGDAIPLGLAPSIGLLSASEDREKVTTERRATEKRRRSNANRDSLISPHDVNSIERRSLDSRTNAASIDMPPPPPPPIPGLSERTARERLVERERQARLETERARLKRQMALRRELEDDSDEDLIDAISRSDINSGGLRNGMDGRRQNSFNRSLVEGKDGSVTGTAGDASHVDVETPAVPVLSPPALLPNAPGGATVESNQFAAGAAGVSANPPTQQQPLGYAMERFLSDGIVANPHHESSSGAPAIQSIGVDDSLSGVAARTMAAMDVIRSSRSLAPAGVVLVNTSDPRSGELTGGLIMSCGSSATSSLLSDLLESHQNTGAGEDGRTVGDAAMNHTTGAVPTRAASATTTSVAIPTSMSNVEPHIAESASCDKDMLTLPSASVDRRDENGNSNSDVLGIDGSLLADLPHSTTLSEMASVGVRSDAASGVEIPHSHPAAAAAAAVVEHETSSDAPMIRLARLTEAEILEMAEIDYASVGNLPPRSLRDEPHLAQFPHPAMGLATHSEGTRTTERESVSGTSAGGAPSSRLGSAVVNILREGAGQDVAFIAQSSSSQIEVPPSPEAAMSSSQGDVFQIHDHHHHVRTLLHSSSVTSTASDLIPQSPLIAISDGNTSVAAVRGIDSGLIVARSNSGALLSPSPTLTAEGRSTASEIRSSGANSRVSHRSRSRRGGGSNASNEGRSAIDRGSDVSKSSSARIMSTSGHPTNRRIRPGMTITATVAEAATVASAHSNSSGLRGQNHNQAQTSSIVPVVVDGFDYDKYEDIGRTIAAPADGSSVMGNTPSIRDSLHDEVDGRFTNNVSPVHGRAFASGGSRQSDLSLYLRDYHTSNGPRDIRLHSGQTLPTEHGGPFFHSYGNSESLHDHHGHSRFHGGYGGTESEGNMAPVQNGLMALKRKETPLGLYESDLPQPELNDGSGEVEPLMGGVPREVMLGSYSSHAGPRIFSRNHWNRKSFMKDSLNSMVDSVFSSVRSVSTDDIEADLNDSDKYLASGIAARAFPERFLALLVTLGIEIPVLLMVSGGSQRLCILVGQRRYELLMAFLPLSSAISGNCGLQSSILTTRAVSHMHVTKDSFWSWLLTEVGVSLHLGLGMGLVLGLLAFLASSHDVPFGLTIFIAQFVSIIVAGVTGTMAPLIFTFFFHRDSGKWGGPMETAIQDIVGSFTMVILSYNILVLMGPTEVTPDDVCGSGTQQ